MELLRCEHLSKIYGEENNAVKALDDVSFSVEKGEFVSIVGPSGSGKSTLIHILGGVDKPTAGTVYIGDTDIHTLSADKLAIFRRRQIGLVYQFYNLLPVLNVDENIVLPHLLDGRKMNHERLDLVVDQMGLRDRRNNLQTQLSGEQQRVSIGRIAVEQLFHFLESAEHLPIGVYITSPNYLEEIADIAGLVSVCKQFGFPLVLTGGAYLHIAQEWAEQYGGYAQRMMAVFASTSPSYLILQSLDLCNRYLAEKYTKRLEYSVHKIGQIKQKLLDSKIPLLESEALKIVIDAAVAGYSGIETAEEMRAYRMECEYADEQYVVLMMNIENREEDYLRLLSWAEKTALREPRSPIRYPAISYGKTERACSIREVVFGDSEMVPVEDAVGRICAAETIACPPAVPIAISGERITEEMAALFRRYQIRQVAVLATEAL